MDVRSTAANISSALSYFFSFLASKLFLKMVTMFTLNGTLWFYSAVGFVAVFVLYFILPETEGQTIEEVQSLFDNNIVNQSVRYDEHFCREKTISVKAPLEANKKEMTNHGNI